MVLKCIFGSVATGPQKDDDAWTEAAGAERRRGHPEEDSAPQSFAASGLVQCVNSAMYAISTHKDR